MTWDQVLTLLTALTGTLASLAALWTVLEMRRQRRSAYKPDLLFKECNFSLDRPVEGSPLIVSTEPRESGPELRRPAGIEMYNAGLGPARHITIEWRYSVEQFVDLIGALSSSATSPITASTTGDWVSIDWPTGYSSSHNLRNQGDSDILVVPAGTTFELRLPPAYAELVAAYLGVQAAATRTSRWETIPGLTMIVKYRDLEDSEHSVDLLLQPEPVIVRRISGREATLAIAEGSLRIRES